MKPKKDPKKLSLKAVTVSNLQNKEMDRVYGGRSYPYVSCNLYCDTVKVGGVLCATVAVSGCDISGCWACPTAYTACKPCPY